MTRQKMYGLVVLVLVITLNGAFPARQIGKWSAIAKASSEQNRQLQLELVGEAEMQRNTPIRLIGSLTRDRYWTSVLPLTEEQKKVILRSTTWLMRADTRRGSPMRRRHRRSNPA